MTISNEIIIERPVEEVFHFLANFENMPRWNYYVLSVTNTSGGKPAIGTVFHQVRKSDAQDYKIIELEYPYRVAIETLPPERHLVMRFTLSRAGDFTKITDVSEIDAPGIVAFFIKNKIQSAVKENLQKLRTLLEKGEVTLQDGRVTHLPAP